MDNNLVWNGRPWQAFKTFAIIFSFIVNFILLLVLLIAAPLLLPILNTIVGPLVGGLNDSFVDMSNATISRQIEVNDTMPIQFTLPLATDTGVILTEDVTIPGVRIQFNLPDGGGQINGFADIVLPEGTDLPVHLDLDVPVDQEIDVALAVDVDIPLSETELGKPFNALQALFGPLDDLVDGLPDSAQEFFGRMAQTESVDPAVSESAASE